MGNGLRTEVLLARQPICTAGLTPVGYELLFRDAHLAIADVDASAATSRVLVGALADAGLDEVVGSRRAWVNVGSAFLRDFDDLPLPPGRVVLEVLEDVEPSAEVLDRLRALRAAGFVLAADDFVFRPELEPLLRLVRYVKLDVRALGADGLTEQVRLLAPHRVEVVAEKVETADEFAHARALGCTLFQGWFFCRPSPVEGTRIPTRSAAGLGTLAEISSGELGLDALERVVAHDAGLSIRLLRLLNSAAVGARSEIRTVRQALVLLGERPARQWLALVLLAELSPGAEAVLETAVLRARACELIGERTQSARPPSGFFVTGLFSVTDALTGLPMSDALRPLPLEPALKAALVDGTGPEGAALAGVRRLERGEDPLGPDAGDVRRAYLDALAWTDAAVGGLAVAAA